MRYFTVYEHQRLTIQELNEGYKGTYKVIELEYAYIYKIRHVYILERTGT